MNKFERAAEQDRLASQCKHCKKGGKIGPKSGCQIRKVLLVDRDKNAWKNKQMFLTEQGGCKAYEAYDEV